MDLKDLKLFDLDSQTVLLITKFVRHVRNHENVEIRLTDVGVVRKVFDIGAVTSNPTLKLMLLHIQRSLQKQGILNADQVSPSSLAKVLRTSSVQTKKELGIQGARRGGTAASG